MKKKRILALWLPRLEKTDDIEHEGTDNDNNNNNNKCVVKLDIICFRNRISHILYIKKERCSTTFWVKLFYPPTPPPRPGTCDRAAYFPPDVVGTQGSEVQVFSLHVSCNLLPALSSCCCCGSGNFFFTHELEKEASGGALGAGSLSCPVGITNRLFLE